MGIVNIQVYCNNSLQSVEVKNVLLVPGLFTNLLPVIRIVKNGFMVNFYNNKCTISDSGGKIVAEANLVDNIYQLNFIPSQVQLNYLTSANSDALL